MTNIETLVNETDKISHMFNLSLSKNGFYFSWRKVLRKK